MTIKDRIELCRSGMEWSQKQLAWYEKHRKALEPLGVDVQYYMTNHVDFNECNREQTLAILKMFPGTWEKSVDGERMDYTLKLPPGERVLDCTMVRIWGGTPPETCRIVEEVEEVPERIEPAHTRTVRRIVCT